MKLMDELSIVFKRFGDEQSTLLDQFERLSFEVQLNQAILGRSFSEPGNGRCRSLLQPPLHGDAPLALVKQQEKPGRRRRRGGSGFTKVLNRLLRPVFRKNGAKGSRADNNDNKSTDNDVSREVADPKNPKSWKCFSRSLRI